jgi:hypothetical protein
VDFELEQNRRSLLRRTLAHSLLGVAPQLTSRRHCRGPSHRRACPPMGGRATIERLLGRALPVRRSTPRRQPVERWEEDGAAAGPFSGVHAHRWVDVPPSSGSSVGPYPRAPSRSRRGGILAIDDPVARASTPSLTWRVVNRWRPWRGSSAQPELCLKIHPPGVWIHHSRW